MIAFTCIFLFVIAHFRVLPVEIDKIGLHKIFTSLDVKRAGFVVVLFRLYFIYFIQIRQRTGFFFNSIEQHLKHSNVKDKISRKYSVYSKPSLKRHHNIAVHVSFLTWQNSYNSTQVFNSTLPITYLARFMRINRRILSLNVRYSSKSMYAGALQGNPFPGSRSFQIPGNCFGFNSWIYISANHFKVLILLASSDFLEHQLIDLIYFIPMSV